MIVTWSETYLRTSLTNALATIHSSPPNITAHLVEPTPIIERTVHAPAPPAPSTTQLHSIVNKTDNERQAAAAATAAAVTNSSYQSNLPDVCIN